MNEEEAIKNVKEQLEGIKKANECGLATKGEFNKDIEAIESVLNLLEKKDEEIEKKDKTVKHIIERLENDIKRITETKTKKSEHYLDDYTRNRLKAYKTKTKEIKEYIEEQYFERRIEQ